MIVKRLFIQNYRCFGNEPKIINFAETGLMAFVGCNNAGKSTALKALDLLLGDKWPVGQFSEDDFYKKDHSKKIVIACEFESKIAVPYSNTSPEMVDIIGLVIEVAYINSEYGQYATNVEYNLIESISDFNEADWTISCYKGYGGKSGSPRNIGQPVRNCLPIAITIPLIKLHSEQPTNKWGILGRMLQKIENTFSKDEDMVSRFEKDMGTAMNILREPPEFSRLEEDITTFWEGVKPRNLTGTVLQFLDYDPWHYYRQFRLAITKSGEDVPLDSLGEGVQRLAVIALYRTYLNSHSRNQKAILLVEEPESYLHPQARNVVYQTLRKAVEGEDVEGQIIYTTHSSDFIDCSTFEEIAIFSEDSEGTLVRQVNHNQMMNQTEALVGIEKAKQGDPGIYYRITEVGSVGLKDALFSYKAVIVEGPTDIEFMKAFGDTDEKQISIVGAGGKSNIPSIYSFLTAFGIPTLICVDKDTSDKITNEQIAALINHEEINQLAEGTDNIDHAVIDGQTLGTKETYRNLTIFSKDLENFMEANIPDYTALTTKLKTDLNLGTSKAKLMFSVGLCYKDKVEAITLSKEQKEAMDTISSDIKTFLEQDLLTPNLKE